MAMVYGERCLQVGDRQDDIKENFLLVYGHAHQQALKPDLIATVFQKTGIWPFNPNVITEEMMAPSHETQWK